MKFKKSTICEETGFLRGEFEETVFYGGLFGGSAPAPQPIYTAPPSAPAPVDAAMTDAITPEDEAKMKKKAITQGAKSLQIPLSDSTSSATVGTV